MTKPRPVLAAPRVFHTLRRDATTIRGSRTGDVGHLYTGSGLEVVWVSKRAERIDRGWFASPSVDLILVLQGRLRVEFEDPRFQARTLGRGDLLVLPPATRCRAYRWPRTARKATVFVAVYPLRRPGPAARSRHSLTRAR